MQVAMTHLQFREIQAEIFEESEFQRSVCHSSNAGNHEIQCGISEYSV